MKSVIISAVLLLTVCIGITVSSVYTIKVTDDLVNLTKNISPENFRQEDIENIKYAWEKSHEIFVCLYDYREIENIEISLIRLENSLLGKDATQILMNKEEFIHSVERLGEICSVTFMNII